jgi:outer membrane protein assembly factor BamB/mono/diheme cytochrome c family protein
MLNLLAALVLLNLAPGSEPAGPLAGDAQIVIGMLEERCIRCHGPEKQKGRLRLDSAEGISSVIEPHYAPESKLFLAISRAHDDPDLMPAKGEPCSDAEILAVLHWINAGAPMEQIAAHMEKRGRESLERESALDELRAATGALVHEITGQELGPVGLVVDYARRDATPGAAALAALAAEAETLVELSFAGLAIGTAELQHLPALPALERLHLERTRVDDDTLNLLAARAPALRYLNLHSTAVTPEGLRALASLAALERLILFGTPLDELQLRSLRASLPGVTISTGIDLPASPFTASGPRMLLLADASKGRIALLREVVLGKYEMLWEHSIQQIHDLHMLENGNILFQDSWTHLIEVDPASGKVVWSYEAAQRNRAHAGEPVEVHAFQRLAGDITMIVESGPARIIEVDLSGDITSSVALQVQNPSTHSDTRLARKTLAGTYLVAHERDGMVREYNSAGKVIWSFAVPLFEREPKGGHGLEAWGNQLFCALRLPTGNTLVTTGNGHGLLEVDPDGQIVWHLKQDDLEGIRLAWVTTVQVLSNGNLILGNCHAGPDQPQLIEINRDKQVLWTFKDMDRFGNSLSNAWVVEDAYRDDSTKSSDGD